MPDTNDRAVTVTYSLRLSTIDKLETLVKSTGKNRSELLSQWIEEKYGQLIPGPIPVDEELARR